MAIEVPFLRACLLEFRIGHTLIKPHRALRARDRPVSRPILLLMKRVLILLLLGICVKASAGTTSPEDEVRQTLAQFVQAFDNLDWDRFTSFFADDATMFQPRRFAPRANNKAEIEAQFQQIFPVIRGSQTKAPYMDIEPRDLRVQMLSSDIAIMTFHLNDRPGVLNRRTIIWQHSKSGWKIMHIHASEVAVQEAH
jgi:ketosteroid isomerase-like protein